MLLLGWRPRSWVECQADAIDTVTILSALRHDPFDEAPSAQPTNLRVLHLPKSLTQRRIARAILRASGAQEHGWSAS